MNLSNLRVLKPSECFLVDNLPSGALSTYDIDRGTESLYLNEELIITDLPSDTHRSQILVPMIQISQAQMEELYRNMLMTAATRHPKINCYSARDYMEKQDLRLNGFVILDDMVLAVTDCEFLGVNPKKDGEQGLLIHNVKGVVQLVMDTSFENYMTIIEVMYA